MLLRLYFLLPDARLARKVVDELSDNNVPPSRIYAHCRNPLQLIKLPHATWRQGRDYLRLIEYVLWRADLMLFAVALAVLVAALFSGLYMLSLASILVMALAFFVGDLFASRVPNVHLQEFTDALSHDEVLLMADVEYEQVAKIESLIERHHPAAVSGGSSWTLGVNGI